MGDIPQTENPTLKTADKIGSAIIDGFAEAAIIAAKIYAPFLGWPVVSTLFGAGVKWIFGLVKVPIIRTMDIKIIESQAKAELDAFNKAKEGLTQAIDAGDAEAERKAYEAFKKAAASLVHSNGS